MHYQSLMSLSESAAKVLLCSIELLCLKALDQARPNQRPIAPTYCF